MATSHGVAGANIKARVITECIPRVDSEAKIEEYLNFVACGTACRVDARSIDVATDIPICTYGKYAILPALPNYRDDGLDNHSYKMESEESFAMIGLLVILSGNILPPHQTAWKFCMISFGLIFYSSFSVFLLQQQFYFKLTMAGVAKSLVFIISGAIAPKNA